MKISYLSKMILLILLSFMLILTGCSSATESQENIRYLEGKISTLEAEKKDLLKQVDKLKYEKTLEENQIVVNKSEIKYTFDDARYSLFNAFFYNEEYYLPVSFFPKLLKKEFQVINNEIFIGGTGILNEGIKLTDSFLTSKFNRSEFQNIAGKPFTSEQYKDECHVVEAVIDYYDGMTIQYNKDEDDKVMWLTMEKPIFAIHRGIKIGSTINELKNAYGSPDNKNGDFISYGDQATFILFEIEDGKVKKIHMQYAGSDC
jgi:hypothetical protein